MSCKKQIFAACACVLSGLLISSAYAQDWSHDRDEDHIRHILLISVAGIFGVVHKAGGYTAWTDKHRSYSAVSGPGDGTNVDDYHSPDINSQLVALPGVITPTACRAQPFPTLRRQARGPIVFKTFSATTR